MQFMPFGLQVRARQLLKQLSGRSEDRPRGSVPPVPADLARRTTRPRGTGVLRPAAGSEDAACRPRSPTTTPSLRIRAPVPMLIKTDDSSMLRSPSRREAGVGRTRSDPSPVPGRQRHTGSGQHRFAEDFPRLTLDSQRSCADVLTLLGEPCRRPSRQSPNLLG